MQMKFLNQMQRTTADGGVTGQMGMFWRDGDARAEEAGSIIVPMMLSKKLDQI